MDRRGFVAAIAAVCAVPSLVLDLFRSRPHGRDGFTAIQYWYNSDDRWHHYAAQIHPDGSKTRYVDGRKLR